MKRTILLALALVIAAPGLLVAQTPAAVVAPAIATVVAPAPTAMTISGLRPFSALEASGAVEIFLTFDPAGPMDMTVDFHGGNPTHLKWHDDEGVLRIKYSAAKGEAPATVHVNCRSLERIALASGSVTLQTPWKSDLVTIEAAMNAKLVAVIEAQDVRVTARTGGTVVISGSATWVDYITFSRGVVDARDLAASSVSVRAFGSSECFVNATERLVVEAVDNSGLFWRGTPKVKRFDEKRGGHANAIGN